YLRYREALGEDIGNIPSGLYPGSYLVPVGQALSQQHGTALMAKSEPEWLPVVREFAIEQMMVLIREDLADLGIYHDVFTSERQLHEEQRIEAALALLESQGVLYRGVLEPPKGKAPEDWEPREQLLFRSTDYGDDCDRALAKSDGSYTYFAGDVAYTQHKLMRHFKKLVMVLGADHGGYISRMKAIVNVLSQDDASLEVLLCQLVKLYEAGQPFKMSKRAGTFVTVRDVLDVVGRDVVRFVMLTRKPEQPLDFDLVKVQEQSKDNPVFYVNYAHARCKSVLRQPHAVEIMLKAATSDPDTLARLIHPAELALLRRLCYWPRLVESAALAYEPHRIAYYLHELASELHGLWALGNEDTGLRFIIEGDDQLTMARLHLAQAIATVLASGLHVLGVEPREEMR
ncbi:MAG: arginine--tRNA ligase, partial [Rickettsiales bacterium]|nr:arginine--tRNA ligase [Rickettsiales bacterium]